MPPNELAWSKVQIEDPFVGITFLQLSGDMSMTLNFPIG